MAVASRWLIRHDGEREPAVGGQEDVGAAVPVEVGRLGELPVTDDAGFEALAGDAVEHRAPGIAHHQSVQAVVASLFSNSFAIPLMMKLPPVNIATLRSFACSANSPRSASRSAPPGGFACGPGVEPDRGVAGDPHAVRGAAVLVIPDQEDRADHHSDTPEPWNPAIT